MRLIDAYALQDEIYKSKMQNPHTDPKVARNHEYEHDHLMHMVILQSTVQEEIVRCKDCKYYMTIDCPYDGRCFTDDGFCAAGERDYLK